MSTSLLPQMRPACATSGSATRGALHAKAEPVNASAPPTHNPSPKASSLLGSLATHALASKERMDSAYGPPLATAVNTLAARTRAYQVVSRARPGTSTCSIAELALLTFDVSNTAP